VGLATAKAMARANGMAAAQERRARQCRATTCVASNTEIRATVRLNVASGELRNASHCGVTDRLGEDLVEMLEALTSRYPAVSQFQYLNEEEHHGPVTPPRYGDSCALTSVPNQLVGLATDERRKWASLDLPACALKVEKQIVCSIFAVCQGPFQ
jgi:hypothetical protein